MRQKKEEEEGEKEEREEEEGEKERKRNYLHKGNMRGREQVEGHAKYSLLELFPLQ